MSTKESIKNVDVRQAIFKICWTVLKNMQTITEVGINVTVDKRRDQGFAI